MVESADVDMFVIQMFEEIDHDFEQLAVCCPGSYSCSVARIQFFPIDFFASKIGIVSIKALPKIIEIFLRFIDYRDGGEN
jgi:hypothetical protein